MTLRVILAIALMGLGAALGVYELFQYHWFASAGFFCSAALTGGLILIGKDFLTQHYLGAGLAVATAVCGFYGFLFENRALDVSLDTARFEAAMALAQQSQHCTLPNSRLEFERAARACFLQSSYDKIAAVSDAARQAYIPPELDLADKTYDLISGEATDLCQERFMSLYRACPDAFSSMSPRAVEKLSSSN